MQTTLHRYFVGDGRPRPLIVKKNNGICLVCDRKNRNRREHYCSVCRNKVIEYGKHRGKTLEYIYNNDVNYLRGIAAPYIYHINTFGKDGMMSVGRYEGQTYSAIYERDLEYCRWALRLKDQCRGMYEFTQWLRLNL